MKRNIAINDSGAGSHQLFLTCKSDQAKGVIMTSPFTRNTIRARQRGQGMTEYIIITALIATAAISAVAFFGGTVRSQVGGMAQELGGNDGTSTINHAKSQGNSAANAAVKKKDLSSYQSNKDIN